LLSGLGGELAGLDARIAGMSDEDKDKLKRKGLEKLREILEGLSDEMGNVSVDLQAELDDLDFDGDFDVFMEKSDGEKSPVRIRIHRDN